MSDRTITIDVTVNDRASARQKSLRQSRLTLAQSLNSFIRTWKLSPKA